MTRRGGLRAILGQVSRALLLPSLWCTRSCGHICRATDNAISTMKHMCEAVSLAKTGGKADLRSFLCRISALERSEEAQSKSHKRSARFSGLLWVFCEILVPCGFLRKSASYLLGIAKESRPFRPRPSSFRKRRKTPANLAPVVPLRLSLLFPLDALLLEG